MKKLYFVRHGLTVGNVDGLFSGTMETPLTEEGRQQATATGRALLRDHQSIDLIICSPQGRAAETARLIARELGYPVDKIETNALFVERNFGVLEGTAGEDFFKDNAYEDIDGIEGVETIQSMHFRAERALEYLESLSAPNILVVSHGAFGRAFWRVVNGHPHTDEYEGERMHIGNAEIVELI